MCVCVWVCEYVHMDVTILILVDVNKISWKELLTIVEKILQNFDEPSLLVVNQTMRRCM